MDPKYDIKYQNLVDNPDDLGKILARTRRFKDLKQAVLRPFMATQPIGISASYSQSGTLIALALVAKIIEGSSEAVGNWGCLIVEFEDVRRKGAQARSQADSNGSRIPLLQGVLTRDAGDIYAFDISPIAMSLFGDHGLRISNGVDIQSAFPRLDRDPLKVVRDVVDSKFRIFDDNITGVFMDLTSAEDGQNQYNDLVQRAWLSRAIVEMENASDTFSKVPKIDMTKFTNEMLMFLFKREKDALRLEQQKPMMTEHRFRNAVDDKGNYAAKALDYKTKFRRGQEVRVSVSTENGTYTLTGSTGKVEGQSAELASNELLLGREITSITSIGRGRLTTAQCTRAHILLQILQGAAQLVDDNPWIQNIFFAPATLIWPEKWHSPSVKQTTIDRNLDSRLQNMNTSQIAAIEAMLSPSPANHLVLIQGPPGTGKTSVIANFVKLAIQGGYKGIWLIAQSNVAVKNIAEKLTSYGFLDYRLLVSKDFRYEWHDHLYHKIESHVIQSDEFSEYLGTRLKGVQVILCTLSMLANKNIFKFTTSIPINILVVDEASQIEIGDYVSVFTRFSTLRKMCFIGDNKQLPPHGQEEIEDLQSIFEANHLNNRTFFLDTQYRMPPQVGNFISTAVYDNKLQSNPLHPISDDIQACAFIHVEGQEKFLNKSFQNGAEAEVVLKLASQLQEKGWSYRIVTPYELQRGSIENQMKSQELDWADKCFNVDSFQGNEDDYIIISLVRTSELGFLKSLRRTNVMLTRFRRKMYIVTNKVFIQKTGAKCLVGMLAEHMGDSAWLSIKDVELGNI